jgi:small subunit ribosomal protein S8e
MAIKIGKKKTGGRYIVYRKKKLYERPGQKRTVKLNKDTKDEKKKTKRVKGGNVKTFLLNAKYINILDKNKKMKKIEIKNVIETPSNRFLARQNVITKGTIIETELGKARVTNRPTQEGMINGVLIQ